MKQLLANYLLLLLIVGHGYCAKQPIDVLWIQDDFPGFDNLNFKKGEPWNSDSDYTHLQLANLEAIYTESFSLLKNLNHLRIFYTQLRVIEPGAFGVIPNLRQLELDLRWNSHNLNLSKDTFKNLDKLEELRIISDKETPKISLSADALQNLPNLERLEIENINLGTLKKDLVKNSKSLKELILFECRIDTIESSAFDNYVNLEEIAIVGNKELKLLQKGSFKNLSKLTRLFLQDNGLKDLNWDEFEGLSSVKWVNLAANQITLFDAVKVAKCFPTLEALNIADNSLTCLQLESFANELKGKYKYPVTVTYRSNPSISCSKH